MRSIFESEDGRTARRTSGRNLLGVNSFSFRAMKVNHIRQEYVPIMFLYAAIVIRDGYVELVNSAQSMHKGWVLLVSRRIKLKKEIHFQEA
jgi:hypothetical protein